MASPKAARRKAEDPSEAIGDGAHSALPLPVPFDPAAATTGEAPADDFAEFDDLLAEFAPDPVADTQPDSERLAESSGRLPVYTSAAKLNAFSEFDDILGDLTDDSETTDLVDIEPADETADSEPFEDLEALIADIDGHGQTPVLEDDADSAVNAWIVSEAEALPPPADDFADILGEFAPSPPAANDQADPAVVSATPVDDLDAMLAEFGAAEPVEAANPDSPAAPGAPSNDFDDILNAFSDPAPLAVDDPSVTAQTGETPGNAAESGDLAQEAKPTGPSNLFDDLDDILGDFIGPASGSVSGTVSAATGETGSPPGDAGDDLSPASEAPLDNLDDIFADFDDLGVLSEAEPVAEPVTQGNKTTKTATELTATVIADSEPEAADASTALATPAHDPIDVSADQPEPAKERARGKGKGKPMVQRLVLGAAVFAGIAVTHGAAFYLGRLSMAGQSLVKAKHAPATGENKENAPHEAEAAKQGHDDEGDAAPSSELFRFADLPIDTRIDGKTIFQNDEIRTAIEQLDGGADLTEELANADKAYVLVEPMQLHGDQFTLHACGRGGCNQQSVVFRYDLRSKRIGVCQTKPYMDGMAISYSYSKWGIEETGTCEGNPFPKGI